MKYLKLFENINGPKVDDYVICCDKTESNPEFDNYLLDAIGQIKRINEFYYVEFENFPFGRKNNLTSYAIQHPVNFSREEILFWSKDKEKCEIFLSIKKYNL
jgi:hypothetical protein